MSKVLVKRSDKRIAELQINSVVRDKAESREVRVLDLSCKGLRFRSSDQFSKGDKLKFEMQSIDDDPALSLSIRGRIINEYGSIVEGTFEYGVRFLRLRYWYEMNCIHNYVYSKDKK